MNSYFKEKRVLVTGACGTVGKELVRQLLEDFQVRELIALDNNERITSVMLDTVVVRKT